LYDSVKDRIRLRFNDSIRGLQEQKRAVFVEFNSGQVARYDLVFGAAGLHSATRKLTFGDQPRFAR